MPDGVDGRVLFKCFHQGNGRICFSLAGGGGQCIFRPQQGWMASCLASRINTSVWLLIDLLLEMHWGARGERVSLSKSSNNPYGNLGLFSVGISLFCKMGI